MSTRQYFHHQCRVCGRVEYVSRSVEAPTPRCCGVMAFLGIADMTPEEAERRNAEGRTSAKEPK